MLYWTVVTAVVVVTVLLLIQALEDHEHDMKESEELLGLVGFERGEHHDR